MRNWPERLEVGLFQTSRNMGPPWGPVLRLLRYPVALIRDWLRGEINVRAMGLAYTTLLSLVPLLAFSISILKGLGARGDIRFVLHQFLKPLGGAADELTDSILAFAANMRGDVVGSLGLALLVYTVISTIEKVEAGFNFVWRVPRPRSFARRFVEYLSVMIVGPLLLAAAVGLVAGARASPFARWVDGMPLISQTAAELGRLLPYVIVTAAFTLMYVAVPNTRVRLAPALVGGLAAGGIWALVGGIFAAFIVYSSQMVAVYAGFAIVLTSLIWVYLSWLILLIGAQLAFYVQHPQYLRHGQESVPLTGHAREQAALAVMILIGRDYGSGHNVWTAAALAAELDVPGTVLAPVLACLERDGLIVATEKEQFVPARDLSGIGLASIVDSVRNDGGAKALELHCDDAAARVMGEVRTAIGRCLEGRTLRDLIGP